MTYENPQVPHEVNVSRESVIVEFARLAAGLGILLLILSALLYLLGGRLARLIPFSTERAWVGDRVVGLSVEQSDSPAHAAIETYLQGLVDRLAIGMDLPPEMDLTVHYSHLDVPNAFATLGGHIIVTSALYRRMPSENALALVLGHEIAHVEARDPISALGGSAFVALVLALLSGEVDGILPHVGEIVLSGYSRRAESRADAAALDAVTAYYGHAGGGAAVFETLADYKQESGASTPSLLSTHPADAERIARLRAAAVGWSAEREPLRPIAVPDRER